MVKRTGLGKSHALGLWRTVAVAVLVAFYASGLTSCTTEGENTVRRRMIRAVILDVSGRVIEAESELPLAGIELRIESAPIGSEDYVATEQPVAVSDADGSFQFDSELDIESRTYLLAAFDPAGTFAPDRSTVLYSLRDGSVQLGDIALMSSVDELRANIQGQIYAALGGPLGVPSVEGARVRLLDASGARALSDWVESDDRGAFSIVDAPVEEALLEILAPAVQDESLLYRLMDRVTRRLNLDERVVSRTDTGEAQLDVGRFLLPAAQRATRSGGLSDEFLTIVLSWTPDGSASCEGPKEATVRDLDAELYLPGADCDVNHLGGYEMLLTSGAALDPAGLGRGTCFWPPFLGGADVSTVGQSVSNAPVSEQRVVVSRRRPYQLLTFDPRLVGTEEPEQGFGDTQDDDCPELSLLAPDHCGVPLAPPPPLQDCGLATLANTSDDGREPEILILNRNRFTRSWPAALGYYYEQEITEDGEWSRRYPMAVAAFSVVANSGALNRSRPIVEVYDRSQFVARYTLNPLESRTASGRWTPLVIEIGSRRPSTSNASDIYFRVVPYDQVAIDTNSTPYFYQDVTISRAALTVGGGVAGLAGGIAIAPTADGQVSLLGQTLLPGQQSPGLFELVDEAGWNVTPLQAEGMQGTIARKNDVLLVSAGDALFSRSEPLRSTATADEAFCGGRILDIASDPEDPSESFLIATEAGLYHYLGPRSEGADQVPASCTAFEEGPENPGPRAALQHLVWLPVARLYLGADANKLYPVRLQFGAEPRLIWPNPDSVVSLPLDSQVLALLRVGDDRAEDLFVGTTRGLYVFRGGPLASTSYRVQACSSLLQQNDGRQLVSEAAFSSIATRGSRLLLGTNSGLAVSDVEATEAGNTLCLTWLPAQETSRGSGAGSRPQLPVFPAGIDVVDVTVSGDRIYVLSRNQGLFFVDWSGQ